MVVDMKAVVSGNAYRFDEFLNQLIVGQVLSNHSYPGVQSLLFYIVIFRFKVNPSISFNIQNLST